ncbi:MAG: riboflavin synthase [Tepidisphaeraceae bacterium]
MNDGMFTGIIEQSLPIVAVLESNGVRHLTIDVPWSDATHGESVAINGVCLTVASLANDSRRLTFDAIRETLDKTNLGELKPGDMVHVERAMQIGARFDGHFVQGHVDGVATVVKQVSNLQDWRLVGRVPDHLAKYLTPKGSISVDGVSMTLAKVNGPYFELAIIPTTLQITQLGKRAPGYRINVECDILAKTIVAFIEQRETGQPSAERFWE